jgi:hypothetical protein
MYWRFCGKSVQKIHKISHTRHIVYCFFSPPPPAPPDKKNKNEKKKFMGFFFSSASIFSLAGRPEPEH